GRLRDRIQGVRPRQGRRPRPAVDGSADGARGGLRALLREGGEGVRSERPASRAGAWVVVVVGGAFAFLPAYWLLATSLTPRTAVFTYPPRRFPAPLRLEAYRAPLHDPRLLRYHDNCERAPLIPPALSL